MPSLDTLPDELILEIASYFLDDYIFDKVYLGPDFIFHIKEIPRPGEPETLFHLIRPYTAMAMVCRRLWNVLPKQLKRPIPLEIVEYVEMCQQESNWARPFAKKRGWDYMALDNRREDWWKDNFWDLRAERAYGRRVCYEPETEAWTFVKVFKEKGCAEPMDSDNDKLGNPT